MHRLNGPNPRDRVHGSDLGTRHLQGCPHVCPDASTNCRGGGSGNRTVGEERGYSQVMVCKAGAVCCRASSRAPGCCCCCCGDGDGLGEFMPGATVLAAHEGVEEGGRTTVTRTVALTRTRDCFSGGDRVQDRRDRREWDSSTVDGACTDCTKRTMTVGQQLELRSSARLSHAVPAAKAEEASTEPGQVPGCKRPNIWKLSHKYRADKQKHGISTGCGVGY
jgi:hypothetical protein